MRVGVLGAGPAASATALSLARAGGEVAVFRPARPGEKPCGGALPGSLLDEIERFDSVSIPSVTPAGAMLENAAGQTVALELAGLKIFRRADLDPALLDAAEAAGTNVIPARAQRLRLAERHVTVETEAGSYAFDWLVGADGARGLSRRTLGLSPGVTSMGVGASLDGVTSRSLILGFPDLADAYLWIFPRPGGCSVGIAYSEQQVSKGAADRALGGFVARHLPESSAHWTGPRYRYPIPIFSAETPLSARQAAERRVLLVGDAVGVADPLTREGIRPAIRSGRLAAECLVAGKPEQYPQRLDSAMRSEMERAHRASRLFFEDPVGQWMIPVCRSHPGVRRVLGDLLACRQPYAGLRRRLLRAVVDLRGAS